jgi:hypothetical protein
MSAISVERRIGCDGAWETVASGLDSEHHQLQPVRAQRRHRLLLPRARQQRLRPSDWSNAVLVSTPVDTRLKLVLSEGADGYAGSQVIAIASASPDTASPPRN